MEIYGKYINQIKKKKKNWSMYLKLTFFFISIVRKRYYTLKLRFVQIINSIIISWKLFYPVKL